MGCYIFYETTMAKRGGRISFVCFITFAATLRMMLRSAKRRKLSDHYVLPSLSNADNHSRKTLLALKKTVYDYNARLDTLLQSFDNVALLETWLYAAFAQQRGMYLLLHDYVVQFADANRLKISARVKQRNVYGKIGESATSTAWLKRQGLWYHANNFEGGYWDGPDGTFDTLSECVDNGDIPTQAQLFNAFKALDKRKANATFLEQLYTFLHCHAFEAVMEQQMHQTPRCPTCGSKKAEEVTL